MTRRALFVFAGLLIPLLVVALLAVTWRREEPRPRAQLIAPTADASGFAQATGPRALTFPADHGPHLDYQTEWWYYTGNLHSRDGRHFGYQLTLFRRALAPPDRRHSRPSSWAADQAYLAHFAITDVGARRYRAFERFSRGAAGLAGALAGPYRVWLEDWSVQEVEPDVYRLRAAQDDLRLDLRLTDRKGPVPQGERGYSQKGAAAGNASYYYSQTRLESSGEVRVGSTSYPVEGLSWMDHEFSTSSLSGDQVGWDWLALQLDDGGELMIYQIRREDGSADPFSSGTWIAPDGRTRRLARDDFRIDVEATWRSPRSGATYPNRWRITVPAVGLTLKVEPYLADQELAVSYTYWEGAVRAKGERDERPVSGEGYMEMTGYAGSMRGQF